MCRTAKCCLMLMFLLFLYLLYLLYFWMLILKVPHPQKCNCKKMYIWLCIEHCNCSIVSQSVARWVEIFQKICLHAATRKFKKTMFPWDPQKQWAVSHLVPCLTWTLCDGGPSVGLPVKGVGRSPTVCSTWGGGFIHGQPPLHPSLRWFLICVACSQAFQAATTSSSKHPDCYLARDRDHSIQL